MKDEAPSLDVESVQEVSEVRVEPCLKAEAYEKTEDQIEYEHL